MPWSLSKWGVFSQCALKYKLMHIDKLPYPTSQRASRGIDVHSAVERILLGSDDPAPPELSFYEQFLRSIRHLGKPEAKMAVTKDWVPCDWKSDEAWLRSVLDFLIPNPGTVVLYDWKTGKEYDDHYDQKELYSAMALAYYPEATEARAIHVYLDGRRTTERTYHKDQMPAIREKWSERAAKIDAEQDYIPTPGFYCRYCPYSKVAGGPCQF